MTMKRIEVTLTALWRETILVNIPDGSTEDVAENLVQEALERENFEPPPDEIEIDSWEWKDLPKFAPPPPMHFPSDEKLVVEWHGHLWATNGTIAIREDAPRPNGTDNEWIEKGERLVELLNSLQLTLERPNKMRFQAKFAPILRAGRSVIGRWDNIEACAILRDDGQLLALVMPYKGFENTVDCDGNP